MNETNLLERIVFITMPEHAGMRLDQIVAQHCPTYSRSQLQKWIKSGDIQVDGQVMKPKEKIISGAEIIVNPIPQEQIDDLPEDIPIDIQYEDDHIMVINKPAGLVVHPGAGNRKGTLVNALLFHDSRQNTIPRAGIVHRLDKDTSGLMVVAKTLEAHQSLVGQLQERTVSREYLALVFGEVVAGDSVEGNIGRHPVDRKKMAVVDGGKYALTHYRIEERLKGFTLLRVFLETGRTHQIRVHLSWKLLPLVGDQVYRGRSRVPAGMTEHARNSLQKFPRQVLHATRLGLIHPVTGEDMSWEVSIPDDINELMDILRSE